MTPPPHPHAHHVAQSFLDWGLWNFVAAVAGVLALATLIFAAFELLERRRQFPAVFLRFDVVGHSDMEDGSRQWVAEISNIGVGSCYIGQICLLNAKAVLSWEHRPKFSLSPGQSFILDFKTEDIESAWVFFQYSSTADRHSMFFEWHAMSVEGPMAQALEKSAEITRKPLPWERWTKPAPWRVGPGGVLRLRQRLEDVDGDEEGLTKIFSAVQEVSDRSTLTSIFRASDAEPRSSGSTS